MKKVLIIVGILCLVLFGFSKRVAVRELVDSWIHTPVPSPVPYPSVTATGSSTVAPSSSTTPSGTVSQVNLDITFVSQAPAKIWDEEHEEFCEEAAALMVASYVKGDRSIANIDVAERELQKIKNYELDTFGYYKDTTAEETAKILRDHFGLTKVSVTYDPTEKQIKSWLAVGRAVLVPSAGRELGNPNFKAPGPLYHMLVVKGYTAKGQFITNDPGTRKGADYIYESSVIMKAMHDWNGGDVSNGRKVVIVVG